MAKDKYLSGVNQGEQCVYPVCNRSDQDLVDTANWLGRGPDGIAQRRDSSMSEFREEETE